MLSDIPSNFRYSETDFIWDTLLMVSWATMAKLVAQKHWFFLNVCSSTCFEGQANTYTCEDYVTCAFYVTCTCTHFYFITCTCTHLPSRFVGCFRVLEFRVFGVSGGGSWWHSLCLNTLDAAARTLLTCARLPHLFIHSLFLPPLYMQTLLRESVVRTFLEFMLTCHIYIYSTEHHMMVLSVPVSNHLMYTESEFAPWDPGRKAHILVSTPGVPAHPLN